MAVKMMDSAEDFDINCVESRKVFFDCIDSCYVESVYFMVERGFNVNITGDEGRTPLLSALSLG